MWSRIRRLKFKLNLSDGNMRGIVSSIIGENSKALFFLIKIISYQVIRTLSVFGINPSRY